MSESAPLAAIKGSAAAWNKWRTEDPAAAPDLTVVILNGADCAGANFEEANLRAADLNGADFTGANLTAAQLCDAHIQTANFTDADLTETDLSRTAQYLPCTYIHTGADADAPFAEVLGQIPGDVTRLDNDGAWTTEDLYRVLQGGEVRREERFITVFQEGQIRPDARFLLALSAHNANNPLMIKLLHAAAQVEKQQGHYSIVPIEIDARFAEFDGGWQQLLHRRSNNLNFARWKSSAHFNEALGVLLTDLRGPKHNPTLPPIQAARTIGLKEGETHGRRVLKSITNYNKRQSGSGSSS